MFTNYVAASKTNTKTVTDSNESNAIENPFLLQMQQQQQAMMQMQQQQQQSMMQQAMMYQTMMQQAMMQNPFGIQMPHIQQPMMQNPFGIQMPHIQQPMMQNPFGIQMPLQMPQLIKSVSQKVAIPVIENDSDSDIGINSKLVKEIISSKKQKLSNTLKKTIVKTVTNVSDIDIDIDIETNSGVANAVESNIRTDKDFVNLFDSIILDKQDMKNMTPVFSFKASKKGDNIIKIIYPQNVNTAHFNSATHPEEVYNINYANGSIGTLKSFDISKEALLTHKTTYEYNQKLSHKLGGIQQKLLNGFIYSRTSKDNRISNSTQLETCLEYALINDIRLIPFGYQCDNNVSSRDMKNLDRELGFWSKHIPNGGHIIIYSVDRLSRHMLKGLQFLDNMVSRDISVHFVTNNIIYNKTISSGNKAMIQSELQSAEKYSNITSEKIKTTQKLQRAQGHAHGGKAPYGYKNVVIDGIRKRQVCETENNNILNIKNKFNDIHVNIGEYCMRENVRRSYYSIYKYIIRWCTRCGMKNRNGKEFTISQIKAFVNTK